MKMENPTVKNAILMVLEESDEAMHLKESCTLRLPSFGLALHHTVFVGGKTRG